MLAVNWYQSTFREYRSAVQDNLWSAFTRQAVINKVKLPYGIKSIMETWTHNVGYPVVTIARNYSARTATAVQSRFLLSRGKNSSTTNEDDVNLWIIPLTFTTASSANQESNLRWLPPLSRAEKITDFNVTADQWTIFNVNRTGMFHYVTTLEKQEHKAVDFKCSLITRLS